MKYLLAEDVVSRCRKGKVYGKKGEEVRLISVRGTVAIVEGKKDIFSVVFKKLIAKDVQ